MIDGWRKVVEERNTESATKRQRAADEQLIKLIVSDGSAEFDGEGSRVIEGNFSVEGHLAGTVARLTALRNSTLLTRAKLPEVRNT